jgi:hypothetical protein
VETLFTDDDDDDDDEAEIRDPATRRILARARHHLALQGTHGLVRLDVLERTIRAVEHLNLRLENLHLDSLDVRDQTFQGVLDMRNLAERIQQDRIWLEGHARWLALQENEALDMQASVVNGWGLALLLLLLEWVVKGLFLYLRP